MGTGGAGPGGDTSTGGAGGQSGGAGGSAGGSGTGGASNLTPCPSGGFTLVELCAVYCSALLDACQGEDRQYDSYADCSATCRLPTWSCGTSADTTGNTLYCRLNHAYNAVDEPATASVECPLAGTESTACL
jgi:hypothetical protein